MLANPWNPVRLSAPTSQTQSITSRLLAFGVRNPTSISLFWVRFEKSYFITHHYHANANGDPQGPPHDFVVNATKLLAKEVLFCTTLENITEMKYESPWTLVAGILETRHAEQCSKRWQYHLDPAIDHTRWDTDADSLLLRFYESHGRRWNSIKKEVFPRRSATSIKNRCNLSNLDILKDDSQQTSITTKSFYGHIGLASTSIEGGYNNINEVYWQNSQGGIGGFSTEPPTSPGVNHPPIFAALLHQMQNQENLPPHFWLDNYFLMTDPLWDGITMSERSHAEELRSFVPQNQELGQPYLGFPEGDSVEVSPKPQTSRYEWKLHLRYNAVDT
ncbi:hypothetical protein V493_02715 [Pseudogymnoascus sp. VKM F-4281 (FW-2241)]|nr:hypothetical protein V493_02715 [Pseudogymnoascus sp. VKM F-4281 (FW-2241)]